MGALDSGTKRSLDAGPAWTQRKNVDGNGDRYYASPPASVSFFLTAAPASGEYVIVDDIVATSDSDVWVRFSVETTSVDEFWGHLKAGETTPLLGTRGRFRLGTADKRLQATYKLTHESASGDGAAAVHWTVLWHSGPAD